MKKLVALIILTMFAISGCGLFNTSDNEDKKEDQQQDEQINNENEKQTDEKDVKPTYGGNLNIGVFRPDTFNPLLTELQGTRTMLGLVFEGLIGYDEQFKPKGMLSDKWEILDEGRLWKFHLRNGVKWHDGQEISPEDVVFSYNAIKSRAFYSSYTSKIAENIYIEEVRKANEESDTVEVILNQPINNVLDIMTFPVLPKHIYKSAEFMVEHKEDFELIPIGTGPYKVTSLFSEDNQTVKFKSNDNYWDKKPYINTITAKLYSNDAEMRKALEENKVDLINTSVLYSLNSIDMEGKKVYKYLTRKYDFLGFNFNKSLFNDIRIRRSIAYAIDRKDIVSRIYLNNAQSIDVPIPSDAWLYDSNSRVYDNDVEKAKKQLEDAGWKDSDGDGIVDKLIDGEKISLSFTLLTNKDNQLRRDAAEAIAEQLKNVGMDVEVVYKEFEEVQADLSEADYDMVLAGYYLDYNPDISFAFHSTEVGRGNIIYYKNEELDELLEKSRSTLKEDELMDTYMKIQKHIIENLPVVSLYFRTESIITNDSVYGIKNPREMNIFLDVKEWYKG